MTHVNPQDPPLSTRSARNPHVIKGFDANSCQQLGRAHRLPSESSCVRADRSKSRAGVVVRAGRRIDYRLGRGMPARGAAIPWAGRGIWDGGAIVRVTVCDPTADSYVTCGIMADGRHDPDPGKMWYRPRYVWHTPL